MEQSLKISGTLEYKGFKLSNLNIEATAKYDEAEMRAEGDVFNAVIDNLYQKFSFVWPLMERELANCTKLDDARTEAKLKSIRNGIEADIKDVRAGECKAKTTKKN